MVIRFVAERVRFELREPVKVQRLQAPGRRWDNAFVKKSQRSTIARVRAPTIGGVVSRSLIGCGKFMSQSFQNFLHTRFINLQE